MKTQETETTPDSTTAALRDCVRGLLARGEVAVVVGYRQGTAPFRTVPHFAESADQVDDLVWNLFCVHNLTRYLPDLKRLGRVAVVVKGCDAKAAVGLFQEHQLDRAQVHLIGVTCSGVSWTEDGSLLEKCLSCQVHTPALYDDLVGQEALVGQELAPAPDLISRLEAMSAAERADFWRQRFEVCIRCYACRQACPLCYCSTCFTDRTRPRWVSRAVEADENWMFHLTRAMHLAGRCIGCDECVRACPMNLPLGALNRKLVREIEELFGYAAGLDAEALPPLATFKPEDPEF